jgi:thioredoxin-like negative regulator of GroEL
LSVVARRYYVRALEALRRGDLDPARGDLRSALELAPQFVSARVGYARLLARGNEAARAADLLRDGISTAGSARSRATLERALGDVLIAAGLYPAAEEAYVRAAATGGGGGAAEAALHDRIARLRAKTGRFAEALDELLAAALATRG